MSKTAIVVGHDIKEPGAYSKIIKQTEYDYNCKIANRLCREFDVYYRNENLNGYTSKMIDLAQRVNRKDYDYLIELHFNKYDGKANKKGHGCESVIYPNNQKSKELSKELLKAISDKFGVKNRGVKEHGSNDRGYQFLSRMKANAIILEPFFGDENEADKFEVNKYANTIKETLKKI